MFNYPVKIAVAGTLSLLTFILLMEVRIAFRKFRWRRLNKIHGRISGR